MLLCLYFGKLFHDHCLYCKGCPFTRTIPPRMQNRLQSARRLFRGAAFVIFDRRFDRLFRKHGTMYFLRRKAA